MIKRIMELERDVVFLAGEIAIKDQLIDSQLHTIDALKKRMVKMSDALRVIGSEGKTFSPQTDWRSECDFMMKTARKALND